MKRKIFYVLLFIIFFLVLTFVYNAFRIDVLTNFSYSYAIRKGEIPYNDFNLIVPLFSPFFYLIASNSLLSFNIFQSLNLTIMCYYIIKLLNKKFIFILLILFTPIFMFPSVMYQGYNFILLLEFILLIYFEKNNFSDKFIGIFLGIIILTKHTLGILLLFPTLIYYHNDLKKVLKRYLYTMIPLFIFFIYLIMTKSLSNFFNLCFLGLLDFGNNNTNLDYLCLILSLKSLFSFKRALIYSIFSYIKKKNIKFLYLLIFFFMVIPIIDYYHTSFLIIAFFVVFLGEVRVNNKLYILANILVFIIPIVYVYLQFSQIDLEIANFPNYPLMINRSERIHSIKKLQKYLAKSKNVIYLMPASNNIIQKIIFDKKISYYDIQYQGNYGYNGVQKILNKLKREKKVLLVVDNNDYSSDPFSQNIPDFKLYVQKNCQKIKDIDNYTIYYKE